MNTIKQALKEAQKRWGKKAIVRDSKVDCKCGKKVCEWLHRRYAVGKYQMGFFSVEGDGHSWVEAFAAADKKKQSDDIRYGRIDAERAEAA